MVKINAPCHFTPGKGPHYPLNRRLNSPGGEEKNLLSLPVFEPQTIQPAALYYTYCVILRPIRYVRSVKQGTEPAGMKYGSMCTYPNFTC